MLNLHTSVHGALGKQPWIERQGDWVYLRRTGYEDRAVGGRGRRPDFRMERMARLFRALGRLD